MLESISPNRYTEVAFLNIGNTADFLEQKMKIAARFVHLGEKCVLVSMR